VTAVRSALAESSDRPRRLPQRYFIRHDYTARKAAEEYDAAERWGDVVWQPDVYPSAARIAERLGSVRIVDLGCGNGEKLAALHPRFEIVGLDTGANLELCTSRYPFGTWLEHDLDEDTALPLDADQLRGAVVVSADVIEHLLRPEILLHKIGAALETGDAACISTPDRRRTWGAAHIGPPPNVAHIREWETAEFCAFLAAEGFSHGCVGFTRANDRDTALKTILARVYPDESRLRLAEANTT
jgi:2-polyprenyl-3-methyl-5-hydroxy-6-metoxy-1,4-benzoquinol methylase